MMFKKLRLSIFLLIAVSVASCSKYQKLLKSTDYAEKYTAALKYYDDREFYKALPLLEELMTVYRGTEKGQVVHYNFANANFELQDYILASYHFKNFARTYPTSPKAEEALFMNAKCYYINSPTYKLDQSNTVTAINEFQLFLNMYPASTKVAECNDYIDKLRLKLQTKAYENAMLYYNTENYKSAIVAFGNVLKDFPETKYKEILSFYTVKSYYLLAENSIEEKKGERYQGVIDNYLKFVDNYPNSGFLREAEGLYSSALKEIVKYPKSQNL
jgi:outer membrane protein assembly factor BamD